MKLKNYLIIILVLMAFQSCKNDIDINAPWKETAVVNGFLDINSPDQYIRITKTFQNASNLTPQQAAQISDSLYFDSLIVKIVDQTDTTQTFNFYKNYTIQKDSGYFASDKNIVYYCNNMQPILGHVYKLTIYNPKSGNTYTSQTSIVDKAVIMKNSPSYVLDIFYDAKIPNYINFNWVASQNAVIYTGLIRYTYTENSIPKSIDQYISINEENIFTYYFLSNQMNQFFINKFGLRDVKANPLDSLVFRKITSVNYVVLAGSSDLKIAVDLSKPNTTLLQVKPDFSNIQGGLGLFTSRSTSIKNIPFDPKTPYSSEKNLTLNVKGFAQP